MTDDVSRLFDEYAVRWARGERPDARAYLERAGPAADELADLIDRYLTVTPPPEPDEESVAFMAAWAVGEPPLVELRSRRGVSRNDVVTALVEILGLDPAKREKVKRYYHQLETGQLDVSRVSQSVLDVVRDAIGSRIADAVAWRAAAPPAAAFLRAETAADFDLMRPASPMDDRDEIDELFQSTR